MMSKKNKKYSQKGGNPSPVPKNPTPSSYWPAPNNPTPVQDCQLKHFRPLILSQFGGKKSRKLSKKKNNKTKHKKIRHKKKSKKCDDFARCFGCKPWNKECKKCKENKKIIINKYCK